MYVSVYAAKQSASLTLQWVTMSSIASQITSLTIVYSTVYSDADQRKHQNSASAAFVRGIHRSPVNSPHKWPVTRKMFPFDDVIMKYNPCRAESILAWWHHQMETLSALLALFEFTGHRWISPTKGQWRGALTLSLICAWTNGWVNNRDAGDFSAIAPIMTSR